MPRRLLTRIERATAMVARMPHVPADVASRMADAFLEGDFPHRGVPAALERFFGNLYAEGRAHERVSPDDFRAAATSRSGFRSLVWALERFAPHVPLSPSKEVAADWDHWLNARYNTKPRKPRLSTRVALLPGDWPEPWRAALPLLGRVVRVGQQRYKPLRGKGAENQIQAVGMLWAARDWAAARGVAVGDRLDADLVEIFARFLTTEREVRMISAINYLERVRSFAGRARLLTASADGMFGEMIAALHAEADEEEPTKREKVREFRKSHSLADIMKKAVALLDDADRERRGSAAAATLVREAAVLALLVNTADRQGDLSRLRIGHEVLRDADGRWIPEFAQAKTGRRKENGALWPITAVILDKHVLGDLPAWAIEQRLDELTGRNLISLREDGMDTYYPSAVLRNHFGISGHLIRTLITDAIRIHRPDAAWAAQFVLGHTNRTMQETYRTDFRDLGVIRHHHAAIEAFAAE